MQSFNYKIVQSFHIPFRRTLSSILKRFIKNLHFELQQLVRLHLSGYVKQSIFVHYPKKSQQRLGHLVVQCPCREQS